LENQKMQISQYLFDIDPFTWKKRISNLNNYWNKLGKGH